MLDSKNQDRIVFDRNHSALSLGGKSVKVLTMIGVLFTLSGLGLAGYLLVSKNSSTVPVYQSSDFSLIENEYPKESATRGLAKNRDGCVNISISGSNHVLEKEECGSIRSTYRIVQRVARAADCFKDSDATFSWKPGGVEETLCLDYDWSSKDCISITLHDAKKYPCGSASSLVRPEVVIVGAVDVSYCKFGGIAHPVRKFTICTK